MKGRCSICGARVTTNGRGLYVVEGETVAHGHSEPWEVEPFEVDPFAGDVDAEPEVDEGLADTGDRFLRYRRQRVARGLPVPTWGEYLASGQPLYEEGDEE